MAASGMDGPANGAALMPRGAKPLREWRIMRDTHYLGRVIAADKEVALDRATEEFRIGAANRFRLIAEPVE